MSEGEEVRQVEQMLPNLPELEARLDGAEREAEETAAVLMKAQEAAAAATRRANALRKIIEGIRELNGNAASLTLPFAAITNGAADTDHPRGREAVRLIVAERPGLWEMARLVDEMQRRGWFTSRKGVEVAVARLCNRGEARRVRKGVYEFPTSKREEVTIESDTSAPAMIAA